MDSLWLSPILYLLPETKTEAYYAYLLWVFPLLVFIHTISDFFLQSDKLATTKSSNNKSLVTHVTLYAIPFLIVGLPFAVITWMLHLVTDYCTSRIASSYFKRGKRGAFFNTIGVDQFLHIAGLHFTFYVLYLYAL